MHQSIDWLNFSILNIRVWVLGSNAVLNSGAHTSMVCINIGNGEQCRWLINMPEWSCTFDSDYRSIRVLGGKIFAPDPIMPRNILPRPGPNPKNLNFMAPTQTDPIIFYSLWTGRKHFIINLKLPGFGVQQTCEYIKKWSHNILQHANQIITISVLCLLYFTQVGNARHGFHLIPLYFRNSLKKYMILQ